MPLETGSKRTEGETGGTREGRGAAERIGAEAAFHLANAYLIDHVGDLLGAGTPKLPSADRWLKPIMLSCARYGEMGQVGTISVNAATGEIEFSEEDREKVKASARQLFGAVTP